MSKAGGRIRIDKLAQVVDEILDEQTVIATNTLNKVIDETAEATAAHVASLAPVQTGAYKESITWEHVKTTKSVHVSVIKADAPHYRLTHLLENGHAKVNGGRVEPSPRSGHWKPGERFAIADVVVKLKKELEK